MCVNAVRFGSRALIPGCFGPDSAKPNLRVIAKRILKNINCILVGAAGLLLTGTREMTDFTTSRD